MSQTLPGLSGLCQAFPNFPPPCYLYLSPYPQVSCALLGLALIPSFSHSKMPLFGLPTPSRDPWVFIPFPSSSRVLALDPQPGCLGGPTVMARPKLSIAFPPNLPSILARNPNHKDSWQLRLIRVGSCMYINTPMFPQIWGMAESFAVSLNYPEDSQVWPPASVWVTSEGG
jgi:hypothetical protein